MSMRNRRRRQGTSLVELLVAVGLSMLLVAALVAAIAGGIRTWERAREGISVHTDAVLGAARLSQDIRNSFPFYAIRFSGGDDWMEFPAMVGADGSGAAPRIGTIRYAFDARSGTLRRMAWAFPGSAPDPARGEELISLLERVAFTYYYASAETSREYEVRSSWQDTGHPVGVHIVLQWSGAEGPVKFEKTMFLPSSRR